MRISRSKLEQMMAPLIEQGKVRVIETSRGVTIEINDSILFSPGQALLQPPLIKAMSAIAEVLAPTEFPITIEGHTDNVPISTVLFPSNWELSTARAASIVRLLAMDGVDPSRLAAVGYGEFQPVADNATPEGRARNRRVVLVVSRNLEVRRSVSGVGSGNATPDAALQRAGTQPANAPASSAP